MMRKRLEWRGFNIKDVEKWDNQQYDVISMLNLLDRAGNPDQFIQKVSARRTKRVPPRGHQFEKNSQCYF